MVHHPAIVTTGPGAPLSLVQRQTLDPGDGEVLVKVQWTISSVYDLYQANHRLNGPCPAVLGRSFAGTVLETGNSVKKLAVHDKVFGFVSGADDERAHQAKITVSENMLAKMPPNIPPQVAVTIAESFVTAFNSLNNDFGLQLPWPRPENYRPSHSGALLLVWGAASPVGKHALQLMRYYHFCNRFAVAPKKNHELLKSIGASAVFDSADADLLRQLFIATLKLNGGSCPPGRFIMDCWASQEASIQGISALANPGAKVSFARPVVGRSNGQHYKIFSDPLLASDWRMGVQDKFLEEHLQPTIMADMVGRGVIKPGEYSIAEGETLLERAQKALDMVRIGGIDGKQAVWRVSED
ncbi:NAD(P)-binding [Fusarium albosuccineum]|uniref:NAD(P)-binding n=1 Tax=Fusarium albosuccineum TaxID=1237068 RepID=A0A8H4LDP3_9HYPO|nr:NAD(P)-binding [Fusarium albosuccineum]